MRESKRQSYLRRKKVQQIHAFSQQQIQIQKQIQFLARKRNLIQIVHSKMVFFSFKSWFTDKTPEITILKAYESLKLAS